MKKPGFLKRIFSFGRSKEPEAEPVKEPLEELPVDQAPEVDLIDNSVPDEIPVSIATSGQEPAAVVQDDQNESPAEEALETDEIQIEELVALKPDEEIEPEIVEPVEETAVEVDVVEADLEEPQLEALDENPIADIVDVESEDEAGAEEEPVPAEPSSDEISEEARVEIVPVDVPSEEEPAEEIEEPAAEPQSHIVTKQELPDVPELAAEPDQKTGWFKRLSKGLSRSSAQLTGNIASIFTKKKLDDAAIEELEDILLQADLGMETTLNIVRSLAKQRMGKDVTNEEVRSIMAEEIEKTLSPVAMPLELDLDHKPHVILVVGVNGSGKTTTIGKLSQKLADAGFSTMLAAGDTFRAAAIEQLEIWGERTGAPVISNLLGSDSSALAYDAWVKAKEQQSDILIMDTAGRLQNKQELMAELEKIIRVFKKHDPEAPHTVLLTLDATTGQNALNQVEVFQRVAGVNGLIMTKLDGSARGGILVAISAKYKLPVYFIGVGEQVEDLEPFEARDFARSIAGLDV